MKCKKAILKMTAGIILSVSASMAQAALVYDSLGQVGSTTGCSQGVQTCIFGDIVTLAGTERLMTGFEFDYIGSFTANGDETATLRLFQDDGISGLPGTEFFTSSALAIAPTDGRVTQSMGLLSVSVPDTFYWAIEMTGFSYNTDDRLYIFRSALPTVGSSDVGYVVDTGSGWVSSGGSLGQPNSLQAHITATVVPVPAAVWLFGSGLLGLIGIARRKAKCSIS